MFISAKDVQQPKLEMIMLLCCGAKHVVLGHVQAYRIKGFCAWHKAGRAQSPVPAAALSFDSGFWQCVTDP